ncbi:Hypothetical predicted protein, partial [Mytilus galloprovincialis]
KFKPKSDVNQKLACSVIVPKNNTFVLKAVECTDKYWTACVISGVIRQTRYTETYQSAIRSCSSPNEKILSTTDHLDNLQDGREYWSNTFRTVFLKWTTNEPIDEICSEVNGLLNVDCVFLKVQYRAINYIPLPCKHQNTAICKLKQPSDSAVIKECQTKNDTTTISRDQTEQEHSNTTSNKPYPTSTLSTETKFLTSLLTTMSTHLISTTSDHTTIIPSFPKTMSTNFISSEYSFVWSRLSTVSASQSQTSIRDTTVGTRMELTTSDAQMNNNDRTEANETTNNVPAAAALAILIIMAVLITVVRRRRREKAHQERNGLQIEPGAIQPMIAYEKKSYGNQRNHLKTQDRVNLDNKIYSKVNDQYQHLEVDVRRKEPECLEAEYGYAMATTSFLKPDKENPPSNGALKVAIAKRAKMLRTSLHFLQGQFSKQKSDKENVAYCDTAIVHTKFLYDTPQQSMKHVNKP